MASSDSGSVWSFHILSGSVGAWFVEPGSHGQLVSDPRGGVSRTCCSWVSGELGGKPLAITGLRRDTGLVALLPLHTGNWTNCYDFNGHFARLGGPGPLGPIAIVLADHKKYCTPFHPMLFKTCFLPVLGINPKVLECIGQTSLTTTG